MPSLAVTTRLVFAVLLLASGISAGAADLPYPNRPIRLIVPYPPGGGTTPVARLIAQKLEERWRQPVIVDNRGGGNTIIGTDAAAKSSPDGYTILMVTSTHAINHSAISTPYDALSDFVPIATIVAAEYILVVHPSLPVRNLQELVTLAKAKPGDLNYSSSGTGTSNHLAAELFAMAAGVKMQHISYRGGGPAITALVGGQVQLSFQGPISVVPFVQSGQLRAIAISGETRLAALPQVPTFTEAGLNGFDARIWYGFLAPAGTPKQIVEKLATEIASIAMLPDIKEKLAVQGVTPFVTSPAEFSTLLKADVDKYGKVIRSADIKLE